jgi:hypothetical protein
MPRFIRFPASAFTAGVLNTGAQTGTVFDGLSGTGDNDVTYRLVNADNVSPEFMPEAAAPPTTLDFLSNTYTGNIVAAGTATVTSGFPAAGSYIVGVQIDGGAAVDLTIGGPNVTSSTLLVTNNGSNVSAAIYFVTTSAASNCVVTNNTGSTIFLTNTAIWQVDGFTATGAITASAINATHNNVLTTTLTSVPADRGVVAFAYQRTTAGTTTGATWSGGFASGDEGFDVANSGNTPRRVTGADVKTTGSGNFVCTVTFDGATASSAIILAVAVAPV